MALDSVYKGFTFAGNDSRDFDVYVQDVTVFNAPARDVEMIEIPGRNGSYALDRGRFENIEITYHCVLGSSSEANWSTAISDLRNALLSKKGYQRLTDDFNAGEYRMAVYKSGLDVSNIGVKTGEFDVVFDCRPQRYLTSGETAVTVTSGGTITNPTLFDASPLLLVDGYGTINLGGGGDAVTIENVPLGRAMIAHQITVGQRYNGQVTVTSTLDGAKMNTGDPFTVAIGGFFDLWSAAVALNEQTTTGAGITTGSDVQPASPARMTRDAWVLGNVGHATWNISNMTFVYGTAKTYGLCGFDYYTEAYLNEDPSEDLGVELSLSFRIQYDGANTVTLEAAAENHLVPWAGNIAAEIYDIYGTSSKNATGNPLYIDTDLGEAYKIEDGQVISSNSAVSIGAELPTLSPGENEVTFTNTITSLQIIPRWWKV